MEVYKEAHLLALQIQSSSKNQTAQAAKPEGPGSQGADGFIQESALKINLFEKENEAEKSPRSLKRETYCLSAGTPPGLGLGQTRGPPEPRPAPPPNQAGPQKKVTSKLPPPRASSHRGKSIPWAVEKVVTPTGGQTVAALRAPTLGTELGSGGRAGLPLDGWGWAWVAGQGCLRDRAGLG